MTTSHSSPVLSSCAPTRPGHARLRLGGPRPQHRVLRRGPLKCPGPQRHLRRRRARGESGSRRCTKTAAPARGRRWPISPSWSTCPSAEGTRSSCAASRCTRAPSTACSLPRVPLLGSLQRQDGDAVTSTRPCGAHAHVEQHIERLKDSGLLAFPFSDLEANRTWMANVMMAADLVRWFQLLCLDGPWAKAQPKALRWGLFHAPGRLVRTGRRHVVRILSGWPVPTRYSAPTEDSTSSTDRSRLRSVGTHGARARPEWPWRSEMTTQTHTNGAPRRADETKSRRPNFAASINRSRATSGHLVNDRS